MDETISAPRVIRTEPAAVLTFHDGTVPLDFVASSLKRWANGTSPLREQSRAHEADATLFIIASRHDHKGHPHFSEALVKLADISLGGNITAPDHSPTSISEAIDDICLRVAHDLSDMRRMITRTLMNCHGFHGGDTSFFLLHTPRGDGAAQQVHTLAKVLAALPAPADHLSGKRYILSVTETSRTAQLFMLGQDGACKPILKIGPNDRVMTEDDRPMGATIVTLRRPAAKAAAAGTSSPHGS